MRPEIESYLSGPVSLLPEIESRRLNALLVGAASWSLVELRAAVVALAPSVPFPPALERPGLLDLLRRRLWRERVRRFAGEREAA